MAKRSLIKLKHEAAVRDEFVSFINKSRRTEYFVSCCPDPPDVIIQNEVGQRWIELTDVFYSDEWARTVWSYATPGENQFDMGHQHCDMDAKIASRFIKNIQKKFANKNYSDAFEAFGQGILVVLLWHPWLDDTTIAMMRTKWKEKVFSNVTGYIGAVFIGWMTGDGYQFHEWDEIIPQPSQANQPA